MAIPKKNLHTGNCNHSLTPLQNMHACLTPLWMLSTDPQHNRKIFQLRKKILSFCQSTFHLTFLILLLSFILFSIFPHFPASIFPNFLLHFPFFSPFSLASLVETHSFGKAMALPWFWYLTPKKWIKILKNNLTCNSQEPHWYYLNCLWLVWGQSRASTLFCNLP